MILGVMMVNKNWVSKRKIKKLITELQEKKRSLSLRSNHRGVYGDVITDLMHLLL